MARRATYLYKVKMSDGHSLPITDFCYARNAKQAVNGMKNIYAEKKYQHFETVCFAEADVQKHPDFFAPVTEEERKHIINTRIADADSYSRRRDVKPARLEDGAFISKEELERMEA